MRNSQITPILNDCILAIEEGGSSNCDFAIGKLTELIKKLRPPEPTREQQDRVLAAMQAGRNSAAAIKAATGLPPSIIYPSRYLLWNRGLITQYGNGNGSPRWGVE